MSPCVIPLCKAHGLECPVSFRFHLNCAGNNRGPCVFSEANAGTCSACASLMCPCTWADSSTDYRQHEQPCSAQLPSISSALALHERAHFLPELLYRLDRGVDL